MKKYRYYTPESLAEYLIRLLPVRDYQNAIDICCGSWNLINAARKIFPHLSCEGVDIENHIGEIKSPEVKFVCEDGRTYALNIDKTYDLILSNPPYGLLDNKNRVMAHSKTDKRLLMSLINHRYECEMTMANLLLAKEGSVLLFIWPSTFVEGSSFQKARREIAREYKIIWLAKLPKDTFSNKKIFTYAVVLIKERDIRENTKLMEIERDDCGWKITNHVELSNDRIVKGNWSVDVRSELVEIEIRRGRLSSKELNSDGVGEKVLHSSRLDEKGRWQPAIRFVENFKELSNYEKKAQKGDVVVCRVGKTAGFWYINQHNNILISDCLLVIPYKKGLIKKFRDNSENGRLKIPVYGVTVPYITAKDIRIMLSK